MDTGDAGGCTFSFTASSTVSEGIVDCTALLALDSAVDFDTHRDCLVVDLCVCVGGGERKRELFLDYLCTLCSLSRISLFRTISDSDFVWIPLGLCPPLSAFVQILYRNFHGLALSFILCCRYHVE